MNFGCIDRTLATGETSLERPPPARYLVRRSHSSQNPQYFSYPRASDPLGSKRSVYACLRQGGGGVSRAISIALHPWEKREDTRERSDGPVFFVFFFLRVSWSFPRERRLVVVPDRARSRSRLARGKRADSCTRLAWCVFVESSETSNACARPHERSGNVVNKERPRAIERSTKVVTRARRVERCAR